MQKALAGVYEVFPNNILDTLFTLPVFVCLPHEFPRPLWCGQEPRHCTPSPPLPLNYRLPVFSLERERKRKVTLPVQQRDHRNHQQESPLGET